ncbi:DUF397 domain-containing protein [Streptomyces noursei]|uniref:DUF397 domain-containing protein n=1 Tax=Streptomyces noursei TaxID=1971 RepID=UPI0016788625|nr:DUF397 domain-containing protein [Streptomyces noursei]MCZ1015693.1 DUF397 domain-containing protein [Streptomyces noursei]GGW90073.1 toxin [Streptomyces noursei]
MNHDLDLTAAKWIKSSYSDANGGNCLEFSPDFAWVKSSYSEGNGGECLEFSPSRALTHALVPLRDSKLPHGPVITVPVAGWSSFVDAVKNGEFAV